MSLCSSPWPLLRSNGGTYRNAPVKYAFRTVVGLGLELGAIVAISLTDEVEAGNPMPTPLTS